MTYVSDDSPYIKLLKPFLLKKKAVACDAWGVHVPDDVKAIFKPVEDWLEKVAPSIKTRYPKTWGGAERHLARYVREILLSEELVAEYCEPFRGKSMEELDELAKSFSYCEFCIRFISLCLRGTCMGGVHYFCRPDHQADSMYYLSFYSAQCVQRERLNEVLRSYAPNK